MRSSLIREIRGLLASLGFLVPGFLFLVREIRDEKLVSLSRFLVSGCFSSVRIHVHPWLALFVSFAVSENSVVSVAKSHP
jgi:putative exporter of polyketide antibiotics